MDRMQIEVCERALDDVERFVRGLQDGSEASREDFRLASSPRAADLKVLLDDGVVMKVRVTFERL